MVCKWEVLLNNEGLTLLPFPNPLVVRKQMKYLTIKDYTSEFEAFHDCLRELTKLHKSFKAKINFEEKDRKHALFLLTGASISSAYISFDLYNKSLLIGVYQIARYILEVHSLVEYFIIIDKDTNEEITNWFDGQFVATRYKRQTADKIEKVIEKKAAIPFKILPKDGLLQREKTIQENFKILSHYSHPTIYSTKPPKTCNFAQLILFPIIDNCVDAQRLFFFPEDSISVLCLASLEYCFMNSIKKNKKSD